MIVKLTNSNDDKILLSEFLGKYGNDFPIPLNRLINFREYSEKVLTKGYVLAEIDDNGIGGVICGYANDEKTKQAYMAIFVVSKQKRGKGIAAELFKYQVDYIRKCGMKYLCFKTHVNNIRAQKFYEKMTVPLDQTKHSEQDIFYKLEI